ncbi:hypothetical protein D3C85_1350530 [compost metagenome]
MKSARSTSSISARTRRMIKVIWNSASVMAGMMSASHPDLVRNPVVHHPRLTTSPRPKLGSHRSCTPKTRMSRMPIRKVGSEMPAKDSAMKALDTTP